MQTFNTQDTIHKAWLYRILESVADDHYLSQVIYFKGGTCASMLGYLDRFSVDLDFDYVGELSDVEKTRSTFEKLFSDLGLIIKDSSKAGIQYFLKYENTGRNTIKIDVSFPIFVSSNYEPKHLDEINKVLMCQTIETMVAHKMCAVMDRFEKTNTIAGRDIYDIHHFFMQGYTYSIPVITERTGLLIVPFLEKLYTFIDSHVTEKILTEDLSFLLEPQKFQVLRKVLKREVLGLVRDEIIKYQVK